MGKYYKPVEDFNDVVGIQVGRLTVLAYLRKQPYLRRNGTVLRQDHIYECRCTCGIRAEVQRTRILRRSVRSCGCLQVQNASGAKNPYWKGCGDISGNWWNSLVQNARVRGLTVTITVQDAWEIFMQQEQRCALSGVALAFSKQKRSGGTASLDRTDSARGYVRENVVWVHKTINQLKGTLTTADFVGLCALILRYKPHAAVTSPVHARKTPPNKNWRGFGDLSLELWQHIVTHAADRQIPVEITMQDAWDQFVRQSGKCALTGLDLNINMLKGRRAERTASLDRIDNARAYTPGNVQWVHKRINTMKFVYSVPEMRHWCALVVTRAEEIGYPTSAVEFAREGTVWELE